MVHANEELHYYIRFRGNDIGWIYILSVVNGQRMLINEFIPGDLHLYVEGNHDFTQISEEQYDKIYHTISDGVDPAASINEVLQSVITRGVNNKMVLTEINKALTYLLSDDNESIIIEDSPDVHAADVIFYLCQMFQGLKCDYRINQISECSYEVILYQ